MPMTYILPEEFAREHARALRDMASQAKLAALDPHAIEPVQPVDLEALAEAFEKAGMWTTVSPETQAEH